MHVYLGYGFNALKCEVTEKVRFYTSEEYIIFHFIYLHLFFSVLILSGFGQSNMEDEVLGVVVGINNMEITTKTIIDSPGDTFHS